jgi:hypothetical protein
MDELTLKKNQPVTTTDTNNPENVLNDRTSPVSTDNENKSNENDDDDDEKDNTLDDLDDDEEEMRVCQSFDH